MGKDHFSDYFKIHDEIHLRYTEFIVQNLTFWKKNPKHSILVEESVGDICIHMTEVAPIQD